MCAGPSQMMLNAAWPSTRLPPRACRMSQSRTVTLAISGALVSKPMVTPSL